MLKIDSRLRDFLVKFFLQYVVRREHCCFPLYRTSYVVYTGEDLSYKRTYNIMSDYTLLVFLKENDKGLTMMRGIIGVGVGYCIV